MASDKIDPRFDPAFQRGFDERANPGRVVVHDPKAFPLDMNREEPAVRAASVSHTHDARPTEAVPHQVIPDAAAPSLDGNPWVRALWVISVVFVVGGLAGQAYAQNAYSTQNFSSVQNHILPNLVSTLASPMVLLGLASAVALAFLYAIRWRSPE